MKAQIAVMKACDHQRYLHNVAACGPIFTTLVRTFVHQ